MDLFFPIPRPEHATEGDHIVLMSALMLYKLAGQLAFNIGELQTMCADFSGYTMTYEEKHDQFVAKLVTRPEAFPRPEIR